MIRRYTTVRRLQELGFRRYKDNKDIIRVIEDMSILIDNSTRQFFNPRYQKISNIVLSEWSKVIMTPSKVPIVDIKSVKYNSLNSEVLLEPSRYIVHERHIELFSSLYHHDPELELSISFGAKNPKYRFTVEGIFGWIETKPEPTVHILKEDLVPGMDTLELDNVDDLHPLDFLNVNNVSILIDSVNQEDNTITFDKLDNFRTVSRGMKAVSYGKILDDIEYSARLLCLASKKLEGHLGGRLKYEKTDRYSYSSYFSPTGIATIDDILCNYQAPLYVGFA